MAAKRSKSLRDVVITRPLDQTNEAPSPPLEGQVIGQRMNVNHAPNSRVSVYEGVLLKRCRLSWRERIVEVIRDTADYSGIKTSYQLLIFDPRKRTLKDRIPMDDIVTVRASCDCYFQIFLSHGKILQFRADNMESQAYWMALIKVGLGRGSIFHVRVHTAHKGLEHALLYSIGVNLPAHRVGQLDRILVLASPINDINMNAWDLNRVKHFMRLDIGIQMELCASCITSQLQSTSITFILDKKFHDECINFLCREAHISNEPIRQTGLMVYPVNHRCRRDFSQFGDGSSHLPTYSESELRRRELRGGLLQPPAMDGGGRMDSLSPRLPPRNIYTHTDINPRNIVRNTPQFTDSTNENNSSENDYTPIDDVPVSPDPVPPRTITRKNHETGIPAMAHPYINFQPHLFQQRSSSFDAPYQISSRIIITNSGEVQYERNVLGNKPHHHVGFHFKQNIPLPPRSSDETDKKAPFKTSPRSPTRTTSLPHSHSGPFTDKKPEKRASEISLDCDGDSYVCIPTVVQDPTRVPLPRSGHFPLPPRHTSALNNQQHRPQIEAPLEHTSSSVHPHLENAQLSSGDLSHIDPSTSGDISHIDTSSSGDLDPSTSGDISHIDPSVEGYKYNGHQALTDKVSLLSDDYEDVVVVPQVSLLQGSSSDAIDNDITPHAITTTQEIRTIEATILTSSPPLDDYIPMKPTSPFTPPHCTSPRKPLIKPRRNKPTSESNPSSPNISLQSGHFNQSQKVSKSRTLPSRQVDSFDIYSPDSNTSLLSPSTLENIKAYSTNNIATNFPIPPKIQPCGRTFVHSPLTPPIPRPRQTFTGFKGVPPRAEDDSVVGRSSNRVQHRLSPPLLTHNMPVTDL